MESHLLRAPTSGLLTLGAAAGRGSCSFPDLSVGQSCRPVLSPPPRTCPHRPLVPPTPRPPGLCHSPRWSAWPPRRWHPRAPRPRPHGDNRPHAGKHAHILAKTPAADPLTCEQIPRHPASPSEPSALLWAETGSLPGWPGGASSLEKRDKGQCTRGHRGVPRGLQGPCDPGTPLPAGGAQRHSVPAHHPSLVKFSRGRQGDTRHTAPPRSCAPLGQETRTSTRGPENLCG